MFRIRILDGLILPFRISNRRSKISFILFFTNLYRLSVIIFCSFLIHYISNYYLLFSLNNLEQLIVRIQSFLLRLGGITYKTSVNMNIFGGLRPGARIFIAEASLHCLAQRLFSSQAYESLRVVLIVPLRGLLSYAITNLFDSTSYLYRGEAAS